MNSVTLVRKLLLVAMMGAASTALAAERPTLVELYTSQGCSSCPPADALLKQLAADPSILALSFHVHYWDRLGWKDPFASQANTDRQRTYARLSGAHGVYTPQMVVDGRFGMVGSNAGRVHEGITEAQHDALEVPITVRPDAAGKTLIVKVTGMANAHPPLPEYGMLWVFGFNRGAVTTPDAGENRGSTLESTHNVMKIVPLGAWQRADHSYDVSLSDIGTDGVVIVLQAQDQGRVMGAASYSKL